jgi:cell division protein FtsL
MENIKLSHLQHYLLVLLLLVKSPATSGSTISFKFIERDDKVNNIKTFDLRQPLVLTCITQNQTVSWKKDGQDVSEVASLKDRVDIIKAENTLQIKKALETDSGNYTCYTPNGDEATVEVISTLFVKVPSNVYVSEEDMINITCTVLGFEPTVWWTIGDKEYRESEDRITLSDGDKNIKHARLIIEKATLDDRNDYYCKATNRALDVKQLEASDKAFVRVKGKLAALWPFIGICAEVVVLCAIILIYEKRRNKTEADESDTDQSPEQKKRRNFN